MELPCVQVVEAKDSARKVCGEECQRTEFTGCEDGDVFFLWTWGQP